MESGASKDQRVGVRGVQSALEGNALQMHEATASTSTEGGKKGGKAPERTSEEFHTGNSWQITPVIYWSGWRDASLNSSETL